MSRLGVVLVLVGLSACSSTPHKGGSYKVGDARVALGELPPEWQVLRGDRGLTFRRRDQPGTVITINASCSDVRDVPLDVLTNHLLFGMTDRRFEKREIVPFASREAERTLVNAKLDGVPVRLSTMVLKKNWCVFDAIYASAPDDFDEHLAEFETMLEGFRDLAKD